jgi:hypothetical protein
MAVQFRPPQHVPTEIQQEHRRCIRGQGQVVLDLAIALAFSFFSFFFF